MTKSGYQMMTEEMQIEMGRLTEKLTHRDTMKYTEADAENLAFFEDLSDRLEKAQKIATE